MCLCVDDETITLRSGVVNRARTPHQCDECCRLIDPGESYHYWVVVDPYYGDGLTTQKMCAHCWGTLDLGVAFTGCDRAWWWDKIHDLDPDDGGFVGDIIHNHDLTVGQMRAMIRCVRGRRRQWRKADGSLLPVPQVAA